MNERVVVPSAGNQLSSLAPPHIVEVTKPERGQAITVELRDRHSTTLDFSGLAHETIKLVQVGEKLIVEFDLASNFRRSFPRQWASLLRPMQTGLLPARLTLSIPLSTHYRTVQCLWRCWDRKATNPHSPVTTAGQTRTRSS
jgi:hypothetical protein